MRGEVVHGADPGARRATTAVWRSVKRALLLGLVLCAAACSDETMGLEGGDAGPDRADAARTDSSSPRPDAAATDAANADAASADAAVADAAITVDAALDADTGVPDSGLLPIGEACTEDRMCASVTSTFAPDLFFTACFAQWPSGYCLDVCTATPGPVTGPLLPRNDCPAGAVCLPAHQDFGGGGDPGTAGGCVKECTDDADCRTEPDPMTGTGYFCRKTFGTFGSTVTTANGYCAPGHCRSRGCPSSFQCGC